MRRLSFGTGEVDRDRFDILYAGICISQRGIPRTELSTYNHLLEKLEAIAKPLPKPEGKELVVGFELGDEGGTAFLEDQEFVLLNELHNEVRWTKIATRKAQEAYTWLELVPHEVLKKEP